MNYNIGSLNYNDNLNVCGTLDSATNTIKWLKLNMPESIEEVEDLVRMIVQSENVEHASAGDFEVWRWTDDKIIVIGYVNNLIVAGDMIDYLLDLLDGLHGEMIASVAGDIAA